METIHTKKNAPTVGNSGAGMNEAFTAEEIARSHDIFLQRMKLYKEFGIDRDDLQSRLIKQLDHDNRSIIEIGTGKGHLTCMLARACDAVVSVDTDAGGQHIAKLNAAHNGMLDKIRFVTDDAGSLSFPDGSFDAAVSAFTFHHLEYPFRVIREMIRVAVRQIIISDFTPEGFDAVEQIHAHEGTHHHKGAGDFDIVGVFLREHGFNVSQIEDSLQTLYVARRID